MPIYKKDESCYFLHQTLHMTDASVESVNLVIYPRRDMLGKSVSERPSMFEESKLGDFFFVGKSVIE